MALPTRPVIVESNQPDQDATVMGAATKDPLIKISNILGNPNLTEKQKNTLILLHNDRFKNRRIIAYLSMFALLALFITILIGIWMDGLYVCDPQKAICREGILATLEANKGTVIWVMGFFTSIIGAYYGTTALRPSS